MRLQFTKMHGLGNDFVVLDATRRRIQLTADQLRGIADRHFGIGCDQVLMVAAPTRPETDFRYRIFNADGQEVEQCGNGARCFARFVRDKGLTAEDRIRVETVTGLMDMELLADGLVRVNMGVPNLEPEQIPFVADEQAPDYPLEVGGQTLDIGAVSVGNPHAVLQVADVARAPVEELGPLIECHPCFPQRVNVGFMQIDSPDHIRLRVFERGVGETLACGSGACAAVVVGRVQGVLDREVRVELPGGELVVSWEAEGFPAWMKGPATHVYEGVIEL